MPATILPGLRVWLQALKDCALENRKYGLEKDYRGVNRWPSFSFLVLRYSSACSFASTSHGTRSTTLTPARSSASTLSGLFERRRTLVTPNSLSISAGGVKARLSGL